MSRGFMPTLACALLLGWLAPIAPALAGTIRCVGELATLGEVDSWPVDGLAGSSLRVTLQVAAGVGAGVVLVSPDGVAGEPLVLQAKGKLSKSGAIALPVTGRWRIHVVGQGGSGSYELSVRVDPPKGAFKKQDASLEQTPDGPRFTVDMLPCQTLDLWVTLDAAGIAGPDDLRIRGPEAVIDPGPYTKLTKSKLLVRRLPNGFVHSYEITLLGAGADASGVTFRRHRAPGPKGPIPEGADPALVACTQSALRPSANRSQVETALVQVFDQIQRDAPQPSDAEAIAKLSRLAVLANPKQVDRYRKWADAESSGATLAFDGAADDVPVDESCPSGWTVLYVNGILTEPGEAIHTESRLRRLIGPRVPLGQRFEMTHWYNPSGLPDEWISLACLEKLDVLVRQTLGLTVSPTLVEAVSKLQGDCQAVVDGVSKPITDLLLESSYLWVEQFVDLHLEQERIDALAERIRKPLTRGDRVVLVCHSQGNFYAQEALDELLPFERQSVGVVALASPASYVDFGSYGSFQWYTLQDDLILAVPGAPGANLENELSSQVGCQVVGVDPPCLFGGLEIHKIDSSYLGQSESADAIVDAILGAFAQIKPEGCGDEPEDEPDPDEFTPYGLEVSTILHEGKQWAELRWTDPKPGGQNVYFQRWRQGLYGWDFPVTSNTMAKGVTTRIDLPAGAANSTQTYRYRIVNAKAGSINAGHYTEWVTVTISNSD